MCKPSAVNRFTRGPRAARPVARLQALDVSASRKPTLRARLTLRPAAAARIRSNGRAHAPAAERWRSDTGRAAPPRRPVAAIAWAGAARRACAGRHRCRRKSCLVRCRVWASRRQRQRQPRRSRQRRCPQLRCQRPPCRRRRSARRRLCRRRKRPLQRPRRRPSSAAAPPPAAPVSRIRRRYRAP